MNPAAFALRKQTLMVVLTLVILGGGILAYEKLGRLEDPTFTIKKALVITRYPGASPCEVEEEVTDPVEEAAQSLGQVKEIYSTSQEGLSVIFVEIKDTYTTEELPQIWDELRRKVNDMQGKLPPGAGPSIVNDDFGDVYGVFFALTGPDYRYAQLKDYAQYLKKELLLCPEVAKIDFWGLRQEVIYVEFERARLAELGLSPILIIQALQTQNAVVQSGQVNVNKQYMRITPTGDFTSEEVIADLFIGGSKGLVRLGDVATIRRDYEDPPRNIMRYNGQACIGLGISTIDGGNVVVMGEAVKKKLAQLDTKRPVGMKLETVYYQSDVVVESCNAFVVNLIEAVAIVIVLLMIFMGWQSGLLIGVVLILTILCTFLPMLAMGVELQKVSLGALILALGILVDNAIVIAEGILVKVQRGENRNQAAEEIVHDTQWPLLGATVVAILAFAAIGYAPGDVGEYCRSLFHVMAISLLFSWVLAVTVTPLLCVWFLRIPSLEGQADPYDSRGFRIYRTLLHDYMKHPGIVIASTLVVLLAATIGFTKVPTIFFPNSTQRYFYVNFWEPQGTHIRHTSEDLKELEEVVRQMKGICNVTTFVGEGALRFILTYDYQSPNTSYGQLLVEVEDYRQIGRLKDDVEIYMHQHMPNTESYTKIIATGPSVSYSVEARFRGPDPDVLRGLAEQAMAIMRQTPDAKDVRTDWRQPVNVIRPHYSETQARRVGVTRSDVAVALQGNYNGVITGLYRENDELIPILYRAPEKERSSIDNLEDVQVWSSVYNRFIPIRQVITGVDQESEWSQIQRRNREKAVTIQCNVITGVASQLRASMLKSIEAIPLPAGYTLEWGGEYKESAKAQGPLKKIFPICILGMFVIVVWLFNSIKLPLIIFLTVPLSMVGVTAGLLLTDVPFGFMAILGFLGLSGMQIKTAIVLIDQIGLDLQAGKPPYKAIL
ncbi:MAG: efflux RND transporter permease subunit, partial [Sedimentisphaerales bacterium]|nr:efflux RND transporter permease subunit [Sedimentisphaerales bacterium]